VNISVWQYFIFPMGLATGFVLDLIFGDPQGLPHPVIGIGRLISGSEKALRKAFPNRLRLAGTWMVILVILVAGLLTTAILSLCLWVSPLLAFAACAVMSWQVLSAKCLKTEAMKVYEKVRIGNIEEARSAVSRIVGRDTQNLSMEQVTKATVETVAENTSDGVIAPLLYLAIGGPVLGMVYKAINTMDSMVGYKNDRYIDFGRTAAKLDDAANLLPARLTALFMIAASRLLGFDYAGAKKIYKRDRRKHASPNSAQTESVCAGALQIALAGDASYFGKRYEKPVIGDALRPVRPEDIAASARLLYGTAGLFLPVCLALSLVISFAAVRYFG
jgi:adenosylcobinamide-phosphate synthase